LLKPHAANNNPRMMLCHPTSSRGDGAAKAKKLTMLPWALEEPTPHCHRVATVKTLGQSTTATTITRVASVSRRTQPWLARPSLLKPHAANNNLWMMLCHPTAMW
jgi:hypothetical protein